MLQTPESFPVITAEAIGDDALRFTFPDGSSFVREGIRHVLGWMSVFSKTDGVSSVELHCRDEYARWATTIAKNRSGVYEEQILMPRMPHGEKPPVHAVLARLLEPSPTLAIPPLPSFRRADVVHSDLV